MMPFSVTQLLVVAYERNHDLDVYRNALRLDVHGGLDDGARLHLGDFGVGVAQTAAAVSQHRVELGQRLDFQATIFLRGVRFISWAIS